MVQRVLPRRVLGRRNPPWIPQTGSHDQSNPEGWTIERVNARDTTRQGQRTVVTPRCRINMHESCKQTQARNKVPFPISMIRYIPCVPSARWNPVHRGLLRGERTFQRTSSLNFVSGPMRPPENFNGFATLATDNLRINLSLFGGYWHEVA